VQPSPNRTGIIANLISSTRSSLRKLWHSTMRRVRVDVPAFTSARDIYFLRYGPTAVAPAFSVARSRAASSHSYDLNSRRCAVRHSPAVPAGGARRSTESPSLQASGPSSCDWPPVQSARRPLRHLVAYGNTNKYRPVNKSKASGNTAMRPTLEVYLPCTTATMLTMTATVKAMDSQRWVCRIHLFQFNVTSSEDQPDADRAHYNYITAFGESPARRA
jgi:hypothetical protein